MRDCGSCFSLLLSGPSPLISKLAVLGSDSAVYTKRAATSLAIARQEFGNSRRASLLALDDFRALTRFAQRACSSSRFARLMPRPQSCNRREVPRCWRAITRLSHWRRVHGQHYANGLAGAVMSRDDLLFWLSLFWFVGLFGAAVWAFVRP
jgi:hypothetical protein